MGKRLTWLQVELKGGAIVRFCFRLLLLDYLYCIIAVALLTGFGVHFADRAEGIALSWQFLLFTLLLVVFLEELVFRFLPLFIAVSLFGSSRRWAVLVVAALASVVFGWAHGGPQYILVQGVGGLFLSAVFLKCGGFQKKWRKALLCSTFYHYAFDLILFLLVIAFSAQ